jgi:hypothetical protein
VKRQNVLLLVLAVVLAIAGYRWFSVPSPGSSATMPSELRGEWVTTSPTHSDRYLAIGESFVTFGIGGVDSQRFEVIGFASSNDERGRRLDTVFLRDVGGGRFSREFYVDLTRPPRLVFKNQPDVVWVRQ